MPQYDFREPPNQEVDLLTALREAEQNCKAAVATYKRLIKQARDTRVPHPDFALHMLHAVSHMLADCGVCMHAQLRKYYAAPPFNRAVPIQSAPLSRRQHEIVCLLAEGLRPKEIAALVHLSPKTVGTHKAHAMRKLGVHSLADLLRLLISREVEEKSA
jgi:DNA-binding CsgD family transcriptional regulator